MNFGIADFRNRKRSEFDMTRILHNEKLILKVLNELSVGLSHDPFLDHPCPSVNRSSRFRAAVAFLSRAAVIASTTVACSSSVKALNRRVTTSTVKEAAPRDEFSGGFGVETSASLANIGPAPVSSHSKRTSKALAIFRTVQRLGLVRPTLPTVHA